MRIAALVLGVWLGVLGVRRADACGYWSMDDAEKGVKIGYLINSASIEKGDKRLASLYLDLEAKDGLRTARDRTVVFDIKAGKLRKLGKVIGAVDVGGVTIKGTRYAIELEAVPSDVEMPTYKLIVRRGETVILTSDRASSLCSGMTKGGLTDEQARDEVRRRVIYYLAWRATGN